MVSSNKRIVALDHLRGFLIFCVVSGHLLEIFRFRFSHELYILIYSFHMPAFAFLSGICSDPAKTKSHARAYIYPYFVFQTLYLLFAKCILQTDIQWQYTTPYWILWYLLALPLWDILLNIFSSLPSRKSAFVVASLLSLLVGFEDSVGYYGSLSRVLVLFPFFLGGCFCKAYLSRYVSFFSKPSKPLWIIRCLAVCGALSISVFVFRYASRVPVHWLYHAVSYKGQGSTIFHRAIILGVAWIWIIILYILIPQKRLALLSYCGKNTMPIFLFHGFVLKWLGMVVPMWEMQHSRKLFLLLSILIPLILCSKPFVFLTKPLYQFPRKK